VDQHFTQVFAPSLADTQELGFAAHTVLPWNQTESGGKVMASDEPFRITDGRRQRGRSQRSDAGDCGKTARSVVLPRKGGELVVKALDPNLDRQP
jgi:hypothetical protein